MTDEQDIPEESTDGFPPQGGTRMFQIYETDLAELERMLPSLLEELTHSPGARPQHRVMFRKVQKIITDVRWNYGPHTNVEIIPA